MYTPHRRDAESCDLWSLWRSIPSPARFAVYESQDRKVRKAKPPRSRPRQGLFNFRDCLLCAVNPAVSDQYGRIAISAIAQTTKPLTVRANVVRVVSVIVLSLVGLKSALVIMFYPDMG